MTVAAAYLVSDGVVLGADSSSTVQVSTPAGPAVAQLLTHAQKVFEVGQNGRMGICTWGAGSFGPLSHRTITARLSDTINKDTTVKDAAENLVKIAQPLAAQMGIEFVGYYLGGWNTESHDPACFQVEIRKDGAKIKELPSGLCSFSGNSSFFTRVFRGYDPRLRDALRDRLRSSLPPEIQATFNEVFNKAFSEVTSPLVSAGFQDLPIREAIDFIYSYLHITVKAEKFKYGAPSCGGPIEVGFISTDRQFRWVCHKPFSSAIIEEEGEYDVG